MPKGYLTTHVLDTARGVPAGGMVVSLHRIEANARTRLIRTRTDAGGRTNEPVLARGAFQIGMYELLFETGAYFQSVGVASTQPLFLDEIPIRFVISDVDSHYHVPLLVSPFGYSTYRGR